jgi:hypothetical protein
MRNTHYSLDRVRQRNIPMNKTICGVCLTILTGLAACGGNSDTNTPGSGTSYPFVPPIVDSKRTYTETIVDNSNNTILVGYMVTVTAVAADGVITEEQQSTTEGGNTVNGTDYSIPTETITYNAFGREVGYTYPEPDGSEGSCTYAPYAGGPTPPLTVGQTWSINYTRICNGNPAIAYSQQGNVTAVESVTVPAGMFTALKLQSTITWTDLEGTTHLETATNWLDVATFHSVKQAISYQDSGTLPTSGYAISREIVLQSTGQAED